MRRPLAYKMQGATFTPRADEKPAPERQRVKTVLAADQETPLKFGEWVRVPALHGDAVGTVHSTRNGELLVALPPSVVLKPDNWADSSSVGIWTLGRFELSDAQRVIFVRS